MKPWSSESLGISSTLCLRGAIKMEFGESSGVHLFIHSFVLQTGIELPLCQALCLR